MMIMIMTEMVTAIALIFHSSLMHYPSLILQSPFLIFHCPLSILNFPLFISLHSPFPIPLSYSSVFLTRWFLQTATCAIAEWDVRVGEVKASELLINWFFPNYITSSWALTTWQSTFTSCVQRSDGSLCLISFAQLFVFSPCAIKNHHKR